MESVVKLHCPPHLPLLRRRSSSISSAAHRRPLPPLAAAREPSLSRPISKSLQTLTISLTATAAAAAAAAVVLSRPHRAPFAFISSAVQSVSQPQFKVPELLPDEEKEKALEAHLQSNPEDAQSLRTLMVVKANLRKLPEAVAVVDRLIPLEPRDPDLPLFRAFFQYYNGDVEAAKEGFKSLLSVHPFVIEAYHGLVLAAAKNEKELDGFVSRVEEMMERCAEEKRMVELRDFKLVAAQVKVIKEEYRDATAIFRDLAKEEPRDFRPFLCQGVVFLLLKEKDEAAKHFRMHRRLVPSLHPYAKYYEKHMVAIADLVEARKKGNR